MTSFYSCRHSGDQYRITKFDQHMNVASSYLCTLWECQCPAGMQPSCRHRNMLPTFLTREGALTGQFLYNYDRDLWISNPLAPDVACDAEVSNLPPASEPVERPPAPSASHTAPSPKLDRRGF